MKLIYGITVSTENEEIKRLISFLRKHTTDDIVVQYDTTKASTEMLESLKEYNIVLYGVPFENHFADFKNKLNKKCREMGADYIFQLDADEMISEFMVKNINNILEYNKQNDVFCIPRMNTVKGITEEHIKKWGWNVNQDGLINFPDVQFRIFRSHMNWHGKIHERIIGGQKFSSFPLDKQFCILHDKDIKKQESQNNLYSTI